MKTPTLTLGLIIKNEEKNLLKAITSAVDYVNDVVIVDTGSTDNSLQIAEKFTERIFHYTWNNDFAAARNFLLEKVTTEWLLFLDADEYLPGNIRKNLPALLQKCNDNNYDSVICLIENSHKWTNSSYTNYPAIKLFKIKSDIRYERPIHEELRSKTNSLKPFEASKKDFFIVHTGYHQKALPVKALRNLKILQRLFKEQKAEEIDYFYLGQSFYELKRYKEALTNLKLFLNCKKVIKGAEKEPYLLLLYSLARTENNINTALETVKDFPNKIKNSSEIIELLGDLFLLFGDSKGARQKYYELVTQKNLTPEEKYRILYKKTEISFLDRKYQNFLIQLLSLPEKMINEELIEKILFLLCFNNEIIIPEKKISNFLQIKLIQNKIKIIINKYCLNNLLINTIHPEYFSFALDAKKIFSEQEAKKEIINKCYHKEITPEIICGLFKKKELKEFLNDNQNNISGQFKRKLSRILYRQNRFSEIIFLGLKYILDDDFYKSCYHLKQEAVLRAKKEKLAKQESSFELNCYLNRI